MACFTVPLAEAIVVSVVKSVALKKGNANEKVQIVRENLATLEKMLYGGSIMFALEHIVNGEITAKFPFLTALETAEGTAAMLKEISTLGVGMSVLVTGVWGLMIFGKSMIKKITKNHSCVLQSKTVLQS